MVLTDDGLRPNWSRIEVLPVVGQIRVAIPE